MEAVSATRRKRLMLLDINSDGTHSDEAIEDNVFPDKEKAKELLRAEIGRQYCNKLFYLESLLKEKEPKERKQQRAVLEQQRQTA